MPSAMMPTNSSGSTTNMTPPMPTAVRPISGSTTGARLELHRGGLAGARVLCLEVFGASEAEHVRDDRDGERLDPRVQLSHIRVVEAATRGHTVLSVRELVLKLHEVLARHQVRVLLGDGEQPAKGLGEDVLRACLLRGRHAGVRGRSTRLRHRLEGRP